MTISSEDIVKSVSKTPPSAQKKSGTGTSANTNLDPRLPVHPSFWAELKVEMKKEGMDGDSFYRAGLTGHSLSVLRGWYQGKKEPLKMMSKKTSQKILDMLKNPRLYRSEIRTIDDLKQFCRSKSGI